MFHIFLDKQFDNYFCIITDIDQFICSIHYHDGTMSCGNLTAQITVPYS